MKIPDPVLEKLTCSICQRYLSVSPIKLYPNRQVKCGRCIEEYEDKDGDIGVESQLYTAVVRDMLFPCINRFQGCNEYLTISAMKIHERKCIGSYFDCPLCNSFIQWHSNISLHLKIFHYEESLKDSSFLINLNRSTTRTCFYQKEQLIFFIHYNYNYFSSELLFRSFLIGGTKHTGVEQTLSLFSRENKLLTKVLLPLSKDCRYINISTLSSFEDVVLCKIDIKQEIVCSLKENISTIDPMANTAIFECTFDDVENLGINEKKNSLYTYYCMGLPWKVSIKKKILTGEKAFLTVLLQFSSDNLTICSVNGTFTLISANIENVSKMFNNKLIPDYPIEIELTAWTDLEDPSNGFIKINLLQVEVKIQVDIVKEEELVPSCVRCGVGCSNCA